MPPATAQPRQPHPPLAHDPRGNALALPDGAAGWRVKRQTAGRPRVCLGPDRQPLRFPLEATAADLLDVLGPGAYRLDAIDAVGEALDYVTTVHVGGDAPGDVHHSEVELVSVAPTLGARAPVATGTSDLRFALEVTAHMARVQSEALRSIASAQAEWIKGLAAAKAIPRNGFVAYEAPRVLAPAAEEAEADQDVDGEEDGEGADDPAMPDPMNGVNTALGHVAAIAQYVSPLVQPFLPRTAPTEPEPRNAAPPAPPADPSAQALHIGQVLSTVSPRARFVGCRLLGTNDAAARDFATALSALPVADAVTQLEELARSTGRPPVAPADIEAATPPPVAPDFDAHLDAVKALLTPVELVQAMAILAGLTPDQRETLKAHLLGMSPADAASMIRQGLAERRAPATTGGGDASG